MTDAKCKYIVRPLVYGGIGSGIMIAKEGNGKVTTNILGLSRGGIDLPIWVVGLVAGAATSLVVDVVHDAVLKRISPDRRWLSVESKLLNAGVGAAGALGAYYVLNPIIPARLGFGLIGGVGAVSALGSDFVTHKLGC